MTEAEERQGKSCPASWILEAHFEAILVTECISHNAVPGLAELSVPMIGVAADVLSFAFARRHDLHVHDDASS